MIVLFKTTLNCNIKCSHCYVGDERSNHIDMTVADAINVLNKIPKDSEIVFHGGEPTIMGKDYFYNVTEKFLGHHQFTMQTNLTSIDGEWIDFIKDVLDSRMSTSFDLFGSLRPINPRRWFETVGMLQANNINPYVVGMLWKGNENMATETYQFFNNLELNFRLNPLEKIGYAIEGYEMTRHSYLGYANAMKAIFDEWFMSPSANVLVDPLSEIISSLIIGNSVRKCPFSSKCAFNIISVNPDGSVFPCGGFDSFRDFSYGNLIKQPLHEVLSSEKKRQAERRHSKLPKKCQSCNYMSICGGGCRLDAYSYHGDIYRETSMCDDYKDLFSHIERSMNNATGDITDWFLSLSDKCDSPFEFEKQLVGEV